MKGSLSWTNLLGEVSIEDFFKNFWSQKPLFVKGGALDFVSLFGAPEFNSILSYQRLDYPRSRIMHEGKMLPVETYTYRRPTMRGGFAGQFLDVAAVNNFLSKGANLIVNGVDEMHDGVRNACLSLAELTDDHVSANAYFAKGSEGAFPKHWDDHEGLIVQCAGRKKWEVFGQSRLNPLSDDIEGNIQPPDDKIWEGVLEAGDFLYVPRGFWHRVSPVGDISLHLTFGTEPPTGRDWLIWVVDRCLDDPLVRQNLRNENMTNDLEGQVSHFKSVLNTQLDQCTMESFLREHRGRMRPQAKFSLPHGLSGIDVSGEKFVPSFFTCGDPITDSEKGLIHMFALDRNWTFRIEFKAVVELFCSREQFTAKDALGLVGEKESEQVLPLLDELLSSGFLEIVAV